MIKSMTGYGAAKGYSGKIEISVELKCVNNRYFDCTVKVPRIFTALEEPLKALISKQISRGKVDVFITIDSSKSDDMEIKVNHGLAQAYVQALRSMAEEFGLSCNISAMDMTRFPDVLQAEKAQADIDTLCADISVILEEALAALNDMRAREGSKLKEDITTRLIGIENLTEIVEEISPRSVAEYRRKLEARLEEVFELVNVDEQRLMTEAAIFADRVAVSEETVRLRSHIIQLREMLESSEPVGRKMDFLVQELNREANTIGSKGNDSEMARVIIGMKAEIEKIREQAQNIE